VGAALAVAGVLMQQVLRNPIRFHTTLGVASGAALGLDDGNTVCAMLIELSYASSPWLAVIAWGFVVRASAWRRAFLHLVVISGLILIFTWRV